MIRTQFALVLLTLVVLPSARPAEAHRQAAAAAAGLHEAALQGDLQVVRQHIDAGVDLDSKDAFGSTPLIVAATFGRTEVARALIDAGAHLGIGNPEGSTPLHIAALFGRTATVQALLDKGADRYALNQAGHTPLDTVVAPWRDMTDTYHGLATALAPLGFKLDLAQLQAARSRIAALLQPRPQDLAGVEFTPLHQDDWPRSTSSRAGSR